MYFPMRYQSHVFNPKKIALHAVFWAGFTKCKWSNPPIIFCQERWKRLLHQALTLGKIDVQVWGTKNRIFANHLTQVCKLYNPVTLKVLFFFKQEQGLEMQFWQCTCITSYRELQKRPHCRRALRLGPSSESGINSRSQTGNHYHSWRNNVVLAFGTPSSFLTELQWVALFSVV